MSNDVMRSIEEEMAFQRRRQSVFGGSDAPCVFGFSKWKNALDVYHDKTRPVREEDVRRELEEGHSIDVWRGNRNERDAVHIYLRDRGYDGRHESRQISAGADSRVAVHVDGTVYADPDRDPAWRRGTGVVEAKSPRVQTFARLVQEGVGPYYLTQIQFNCAVTGRDWGALALFCDHHDAGPVLPVETAADPELGRMMVDRAEAFMSDHVAARVPPDPDDWDISGTDEAIEALLDRSGEYELVDDETFADEIGRRVVDRYLLQKEAKDRYEEARTDAHDWIEANLETDAVVLPSGDKLRIVRSTGRTYLDRDRLRDHRPIDRDALVRAINDGMIDLDPHMFDVSDELPWDEMIDRVLARLELDFDRFESTSNPSAHLRVYPQED